MLDLTDHTQLDKEWTQLSALSLLIENTGRNVASQSDGRISSALLYATSLGLESSPHIRGRAPGLWAAQPTQLCAVMRVLPACLLRQPQGSAEMIWHMARDWKNLTELLHLQPQVAGGWPCWTPQFCNLHRLYVSIPACHSGVVWFVCMCMCSCRTLSVSYLYCSTRWQSHGRGDLEPSSAGLAD